MNFRKFTSFDQMITPMIVKILFWVGIIAVGLFALVGFFGGIVNGIIEGDFGAVFGAMIGVPIMTVVGILLVRIYAELLIVVFQINNHLSEIKELLKKKAGE